MQLVLQHCRKTLYSDVARFTKDIKLLLQQISLLTGLNVGGKTRNIAIQLVLQQSYKTSCTFFVARFSVPLLTFGKLTNGKSGYWRMGARHKNRQAKRAER